MVVDRSTQPWPIVTYRPIIVAAGSPVGDVLRRKVGSQQHAQRSLYPSQAQAEHGCTCLDRACELYSDKSLHCSCSGIAPSKEGSSVPGGMDDGPRPYV